LTVRVRSSLLRKNASFRRYFIGQSASLVGDQISALALPLTAVLALHASVVQMSALETAYLLPNLAFSLHAGVWIDRRGRRRQTMLVSDLLRALVIASVPLAYAFGALTWAQLYAVAILSGTMSVIFYVADASLFPTIVPRDDHLRANSLFHGSRAFADIAGSGLGGTLVQVFSGPYALLADAATFLWSSLFLSRIRIEEPSGTARESGDLLAGMAWIRDNATIRAALLGIATLNFFNLMFAALFVLYATRSLGVRPATLGIVLAAAAIGTLAGSFAAASIGQRIGIGRTLILGCFLFPAPLILIPAASGPHRLVIAILFSAEAASGFGLMLLDIMAGTLLAGTVPQPLRSRVAGAFMLVNNGVRPLGTATAGILGVALGVRSTLWIASLGALLGLLWLLPSPLRHLRQLPRQAEHPPAPPLDD
jgi:MFS family permease